MNDFITYEEQLKEFETCCRMLESVDSVIPSEEVYEIARKADEWRQEAQEYRQDVKEMLANSKDRAEEAERKLAVANDKIKKLQEQIAELTITPSSVEEEA